MKLIISQQNTWSDVNASIKEALQIQEKKNYVYAYKGLAHCFKELLSHFERFAPHKKKIAYIEGMTPALETLVHFAQDKGYQLIPGSRDEVFADPQNWLKSLDHDVVFVLFPEDHPFTAQKYPWQELDQQVQDRRIFSIRVDHCQCVRPDVGRKLGRYEVSLHCFSDSFVLARGGASCRFQSLVADDLPWSINEVMGILSDYSECPEEDRDLVLNFEGKSSQYWSSLSDLDNKDRLFDRALVFWPDLDSSAVRELILQKMHWSEADEKSLLLESLSSCRWPLLRAEEFSSQTLRGLLVIGIELLRNPQFEEVLLQSVQEVRQLGGDIS